MFTSILKIESAPIHTGKAHVFIVAISLRPAFHLDRPILHWKQSFQMGATFLKTKNIDLLWQIAVRTELLCRAQSFGGRQQRFAAALEVTHGLPIYQDKPD